MGEAPEGDQGGSVGKSVVIGWIITLVGTAVWLYGYFAIGHSPFFDWHTHTPWWIADYLPNIESEVGMTLVCAGTALTYWPSRGQR